MDKHISTYSILFEGAEGQWAPIEFIKYIFTDFLEGFENSITTVAEELRGFGERGMHPYHVAAIINYKTGL